MKLYRWRSEYLESYAKGDIIVMAPSVEEARKLAWKEFEIHVRENRFWMFDDVDELGDFPFLKDEYYELLSKFENDISIDPVVVDRCVLFINGSQ